MFKDCKIPHYTVYTLFSDRQEHFLVSLFHFQSSNPKKIKKINPILRKENIDLDAVKNFDQSGKLLARSRAIRMQNTVYCKKEKRKAKHAKLP